VVVKVEQEVGIIELCDSYRVIFMMFSTVTLKCVLSVFMGPELGERQSCL
jgi:hypothetical protein